MKKKEKKSEKAKDERAEIKPKIISVNKDAKKQNE